MSVLLFGNVLLQGLSPTIKLLVKKLYLYKCMFDTMNLFKNSMSG